MKSIDGDDADSFGARFCRLAGARSDLELARMFKVPISTIRRWKAGTTSPHPRMQSIALLSLDKANKTFLVDREWLLGEVRKGFTGYFLPITWTYRQIKNLLVKAKAS